MTTIKSIVKDLFFDKELVTNIGAGKINEHILYMHLISGKITMQEYIALA